MPAIRPTEARANLCKLLGGVQESRELVLISGKRASAVLVVEDGWRAIRETLHLPLIFGMSESIRKSLATSLDGCAERTAW
jgi:PHD/YefM family antitoxin component YafN of YafNO toxin-antitoxin module